VGMEPLSIPTSRRVWEDNIKMDFFNKYVGEVDWIDVTQDRDKR
jgi:hypothetical protein